MVAQCSGGAREGSGFGVQDLTEDRFGQISEIGGLNPEPLTVRVFPGST
jgi:hypothetical protein